VGRGRWRTLWVVGWAKGGKTGLSGVAECCLR